MLPWVDSNHRPRASCICPSWVALCQLSYTAFANMLILVAYQTATEDRSKLNDPFPYLYLSQEACLYAPLLW